MGATRRGGSGTLGGEARPGALRGGTLRGVEAVIDKDRTASLLARELGANLLLMLTGVPRVSRNYGKKNEQPLPLLSLRQARRLLTQGQFPAGSMGPKIEATMDFVAATGRPGLITSVEHLAAALVGDSGTVIVRDLRDARGPELGIGPLRPLTPGPSPTRGEGRT